jgi:ABC-2 type transport system ATP-binding protein
MKCELAAALLHRPQVLFLDEPTIGLDVTMQSVVRDFIKTYNERHGATVILTSHYMDDVAALCPRVIVIDHGRLSWDGPLTELARRTRPEKRVTLRFGAEVAAAQLHAIGGRVLRQEATLAVVQVMADELRDVVSAALTRLPVIDLNVEDAPLEEVLSELFARGRAAS